MYKPDKDVTQYDHILLEVLFNNEMIFSMRIQHSILVFVPL